MLKLLLIFLSFTILYGNGYSLRKYSHVKEFYKDTLPIALKVGYKYNIPPASLLAIAGVESGYGRGYVAQITGNILSLGANKNDTALPPLYLPYSKKDKKILFDSNEIKKEKKENLIWKRQAKSYKKDYRPKDIRGKEKDFEYFKYNKPEKLKAYEENFTDFAVKFISYNSKFKPFREARAFLDNQVKKYGKDILLEKWLNEKFIEMIGGKPNSFNYRESWPKKVKYILNNAGLVELVKDIKLYHKSFEDAWKSKNDIIPKKKESKNEIK